MRKNAKPWLRLIPLLALSACADLKTGKAALRAQDYAAARVHFEDLSRRGFPEAETKLGEMYMSGKGTKRDATKALTLFIAAAREKDAAAVLALGDACRDGSGTAKTPARAKGLYERALALGSVRAYARLGELELSARHYDAAAAYFNEALAHGDTDAWLLLGEAQEGRGQAAEAEASYKKALAAGIPRASVRIGGLYKDKDGAQALYWYYKARKAGVPDMERRIAHIEKKLQPEQLARALRLAAQD